MKFGGIPVEFVPPGMTAEEARRRRKRQIGVSAHDKLLGVGSIVLLLFLCAGSGWYYVGRGRADEAAAPAEAEVSRLEPAQLTATAGPPSPSPMHLTISGSSTPLPSPLTVLSSVGRSPVATPSPPIFALLGVITATITPTNTAPPVHVAVVDLDPRPTNTPVPSPTPTKSPYDYEMIGNEIQPSDLYSYVSGWIVETDGQTPRPARARLKFATGEMLFPRPNNRDVANGHYEFMVTPGRYWLSVGDGSPEIQIDVSGDPARYEISFRDLSGSPLSAPARSVPWDEPDHRPARPRPPPAVTLPTIEYQYHLFFPIVINNPLPNKIYFPLMRSYE